MKSLIVLLALMAVVALPAQTTTTYSTTDTKPATGKDDGKKKEEAPKIPGQTIDRTGGGYLGLELVEGTFKLSFYDAKKKPIPADRAMAIARWLVKYNKSGDERATLNLSSDGKSLVGAKIVRAPYAFKLYLTIFKDADENATAVENYIIDFSA